jgi:hypothetical protein
MRPRSIINFERLYLLAILIGAIHTAVQWPALTATASPTSVLLVQLFTFGVTLLLVVFVSRRRSKVARVLLVAAFLVGLPMLGEVFKSGVFGGTFWVLVGQVILQAVALALLFTPPSRAWFARDAAAEGGLPGARQPASSLR